VPVFAPEGQRPRLTGTGPVQKIDLGIVRAICAALKVEIGDLIQFEKPKSYMRG
jgi:DNA-binding Xre family transcriptional regulator